jgi:hypothetical protein
MTTFWEAMLLVLLKRQDFVQFYFNSAEKWMRYRIGYGTGTGNGTGTAINHYASTTLCGKLFTL